MDKQAINLMSAELCGIVIPRIDGRYYVMGIKHPDFEWDIFPDTPQGAWCREQVVKALGEQHGIAIGWLLGTIQKNEWEVYDQDGNIFIVTGYPEAIAAAVECVQGGK